MAKDDRLYARFDIGMDEHPKIILLSDAAFRALHEATYYSRRQTTDGFLPDGVVRRRWPAEAIAELMANDPERPSLYPFTKAGVSGLMIHDFDKHQTTTADIEAKREAGRKGGLAKAKQNASRPVAPASKVPVANGKQTSSSPLAITETETETDTSTSKEVERGKRASRVPLNFTITPEMREWARGEVPLVDLDAKLGEWRDYWTGAPSSKGLKSDWVATWRNGMRKQQEFAMKDRGILPQTPADAVMGCASNSHTFEPGSDYCLYCARPREQGNPF